jgi:hypothetical protein
MIANQVGAQKFLQLEKYGSFNYVRFYIGEDIKFQLKNDNSGWHTRTITDFDVDGGHIIFYNHPVHIDSIEVIQLARGNGMQIVGGALQIGGANSMLFSIAYPIFQNQPVNWAGVGYGALGIAVGTALRRLFRTKKFVPGKKKRLRLLDLSFGPPMPKPIKS